MMFFIYVVAAALLATGLFFAIRYFAREYIRYRDSQIITCPENHEAAIVQVDALHAALTSAFGAPDIRLQNCGRWPLMEKCGQECLVQLDGAPPECLVRGVLMRWYESKSCLYCGKPFLQIPLLDHKPALQSPEGQLMEWSEVNIDDLQTVMDTYSPVCWDCYIAQSFVRDHPESVVYRPFQPGIHRSP